MPAAAVGLLLAAAAAVYLSCLDLVFFGRLNDDARHWLAALSLLKGRYVDLSHPDLPPLGIPPPGYPLLLLPAAWVGSTRLAQWLSVACSLGGTLACLRLFKGQPLAGFAAAALAAFNPLTVLQATPLMSDASFFLLSTASLAALASALERPEAGRDAALAAALLAAAATWVRAQGAALFAAAALTLPCVAGGRRLLWVSLAAGLPLAAAPHLWALLRADPTSTYYAHLTTAAYRPDSAGVGALGTILDNVRFYAGALTTRTLLSWVAPLPGESSALAWAAAAGLLAALGRAGARAFAEGGSPRLVTIYLAAYVGMHLAWSNQFRRYAYPLLPLLYWLLLRGFEGRARLVWGAAAPLLLLFAALDGSLAWSSHLRRPNENVPPAGTIEWLKAHTAPGDVLAGRYREMFASRTGRYVLELLMIPDPDDWFHELARRRVRFVVNHPEGETMETVRRAQFRHQAATTIRRLEDPARFRLALRAEGEPFVVYELLDAENFERGYELFALGREEAKAGKLAEARVRFEAARRTGAALVRLPFYLGTTELLLGRPAEARRWLEGAVRREPDYLPAKANLDRLTPNPSPIR